MEFPVLAGFLERSAICGVYWQIGLTPDESVARLLPVVLGKCDLEFMKKTLLVLSMAVACLPVFGAASISDKNLSYYWDFDNESNLHTFYSGNTSTATAGFGSYKTYSPSGSLTKDGYITTTANTNNNGSLYANNMAGLSISNFSISFDVKNYVSGSALFYFNNDYTLASAMNRWGWGTGTDTGSFSTAVTGTAGRNTWTSIVLSFSNGVMSVYADGTLLGSGGYSTAKGNPTSFQLGGSTANSSIVASFDNLAIWNTALDQETAAKLKGRRADEAFVPEPATATLSLLGLCALFLRRRRA